MLRVQGRARNGAVNILRSLSALAEDAISDEAAEFNFVKSVRIRATDPRVRLAPFRRCERHLFVACDSSEANARLVTLRVGRSSAPAVVRVHRIKRCSVADARLDAPAVELVEAALLFELLACLCDVAGERHGERAAQRELD
jgi:hypothetical protein